MAKRKNHGKPWSVADKKALIEKVGNFKDLYQIVREIGWGQLNKEFNRSLQSKSWVLRIEQIRREYFFCKDCGKALPHAVRHRSSGTCEPCYNINHYLEITGWQDSLVGRYVEMMNGDNIGKYGPRTREHPVVIKSFGDDGRVRYANFMGEITAIDLVSFQEDFKLTPTKLVEENTCKLCGRILAGTSDDSLCPVCLIQRDENLKDWSKGKDICDTCKKPILDESDLLPLCDVLKQCQCNKEMGEQAPSEEVVLLEQRIDELESLNKYLEDVLARTQKLHQERVDALGKQHDLALNNLESKLLESEQLLSQYKQKVQYLSSYTFLHMVKHIDLDDAIDDIRTITGWIPPL